MKAQNKFYKIVCEEVDVFGKLIHHDKNCGNLDEVHDFVEENMDDHPEALWILYPMFM